MTYDFEAACRAADYVDYDFPHPNRARVTYAWFDSLFAKPHNEIRVMLNSSRLKEVVAAGMASLTVSSYVDTPSGQLFLPWYHKPDGSRTDYDDPEGTAWNHAEIASPVPPSIDGFEPTSTYETTGKYWHYLNQEARVLTIDVPEGKLVLDGNHRLASHLRQFPDMPVDIPHYHIHAPASIGRELLPDLQYWNATAPAYLEA
jgi:hypothetical protein